MIQLQCPRVVPTLETWLEMASTSANHLWRKRNWNKVVLSKCYCCLCHVKDNNSSWQVSKNGWNMILGTGNTFFFFFKACAINKVVLSVSWKCTFWTWTKQKTNNTIRNTYCRTNKSSNTPAKCVCACVRGRSVEWEQYNNNNMATAPNASNQLPPKHVPSSCYWIGFNYSNRVSM